MMKKRTLDWAAIVVCVFWACVVLPRMVTGKYSVGVEWGITWVGGCLRLALLAVTAYAATRGLQALDRDNPSRPSQAFIAGGFLVYFMAQSTLFLLTVLSGGETPYPSIADVGFFIATGLLIVGVFLAIRAWLKLDLFPDGGRKAALAGLVVAVPLVVGVAWTISSMMAVELPRTQLAADILYPVFNTVVLVCTVAMLRLSLLLGRGMVGVVWRSLLTGFSAMSIADVMYSFLQGFDIWSLDPMLDLLYMVAYAMFARGTLLQMKLLRD